MKKMICQYEKTYLATLLKVIGDECEFSGVNTGCLKEQTALPTRIKLYR
jgi:hypothetical protein